MLPLQNIIASVLSRSRTESFTERKLFYLERGHDQPVILIHSTLNDFRVWQVQIGSFAQKFNVVSYSRRYSYLIRLEDLNLSESYVACHEHNVLGPTYNNCKFAIRCQS
jgi:hypothetical protein